MKNTKGISLRTKACVGSAVAASMVAALCLPAVAHAQPVNLVPEFSVSVVSPTETYPYNILSLKTNSMAVSGYDHAFLKVGSDHLIKASGYVWAGDILPQIRFSNGQVRATVPTTIKINWNMDQSGIYGTPGSHEVKVDVVYTGTDYPNLRGVASWSDGVVASMPTPMVTVKDGAAGVTKWRFDLSGLKFFGRLDSKYGLPANLGSTSSSQKMGDKNGATSMGNQVGQSTQAGSKTGTQSSNSSAHSQNVGSATPNNGQPDPTTPSSPGNQGSPGNQATPMVYPNNNGTTAPSSKPGQSLASRIFHFDNAIPNSFLAWWEWTKIAASVAALGVGAFVVAFPKVITNPLIAFLTKHIVDPITKSVDNAKTEINDHTTKTADKITKDVNDHTTKTIDKAKTEINTDTKNTIKDTIKEEIKEGKKSFKDIIAKIIADLKNAPVLKVPVPGRLWGTNDIDVPIGKYLANVLELIF